MRSAVGFVGRGGNDKHDITCLVWSKAGGGIPLVLQHMCAL